jgi:hypothetical protein
MRARSIKPGICDNEILGTADPFYTLLFERLWLMADREGRLEDRPARIKAQAFPYRDGLDVEPMLTWLSENEFIARYETAGKRYIQILAFLKHQNPHKHETASVIPAMAVEVQPMAVEQPPLPVVARSSLTPSSLTPDCGLLTPDCSALATDAMADAALNGHGRKMTPEGAMAIALRDLGVSVRSTDPVLHGWLTAGFTVQQAVDAVGIARIRKPHPEVIPPKYLDKILREPARAPPPRVTYRTADEIEAEERARGDFDAQH